MAFAIASIANFLETRQVVMMKIDLGSCFLRPTTKARNADLNGPCGHCGDVLDGAWKAGYRGRYVFLTNGGLLQFCGPRCVADHLKGDGRSAVWSRYDRTFPREERGFGFNGCAYCGHAHRRAHYLMVDVPLESLWESEKGPSFCSMECAIAAFEKDAVYFREWGLGPWLVPIGGSLLTGPTERPHRAAALKRLRRKLRPHELARLGY